MGFQQNEKIMEPQEPMGKFVPRWIIGIRNVLLIIIGLLTAWNTYKSDKIDGELEAESQRLQNLITQKEFENELRFKVFDEVKNAISGKDTALQEAVKIMIETILNDDSTFQEKMRTILLASGNTSEEVKKDIQETEKFRVSQEKLKVQQQNFTKQTEDPSSDISIAQSKYEFRVDVFYLEDILAESKPRAEKVVSLLKKEYPKYDVRLRLLPRTINAQKGYRVDFNQIRYGAGEKAVAEKIASKISSKNIFELEKPKLYTVKSKSDKYISIFIRNM